MENNERDRKLEQWLDEALSQYSAAEPRLGLEQRVVSQVRSEEKARAAQRSWWRWMPAFAAIAAVLIVMVAVRPYWESKPESTHTFVSTPVLETRQAPEANNEIVFKAGDTGSTGKDKRIVQGAKKSAPAFADSRRKEDSKTVQPAMLAKDASLDEKHEAAVNAEVRRVPASRAFRGANDVAANSNAPVRELDAATEKKQARTLQPSAPQVSAPSAPPPPAVGSYSRAVAGGALGGTVSNGRADAAKVAAVPQSTSPANSSAVQAETIFEVQGVSQAIPTQTVQLKDGIIATEQVAVPDVSAQMKPIKLKPKGALAKKLDQKVNTFEVPGMGTVRTELTHIPPGPTQKFPTPTPLSKEEQLMLAAAKQLKGKPANEEKSDGGIPAIEIKKVEIAPLAGPPK